MSIRRVPWSLLVMVLAMPASAQSIMDTVRQLRSTVGQLTGRRQAAAPPTTPSGAAASGASTASASDAGEFVTADVLADDASDTSLERAPLIPRHVITFEVRGLRLGMSPREVGRIAERQGFRRRFGDSLLTSGSFEVEAAVLANRKLDRPVEKTSSLQLMSVTGSNAAGDRLICGFTLEPAGPRLSDLRYQTKLSGSTRQQVVTALTGKYGPPTEKAEDVPQGNYTWSNESGPLDGSSPKLFAIVGQDGMTLFLSQSSDYTQAAKKRLEARAQQIAASRGGGVRF